MIKNIIFDLGNVIIDLDLDQTEVELKKIFGEDLSQKLTNAGLDRIFIDYEMGLLGESDFLEKLQSIDSTAISKRRIIDAWNAMLLGTPYARLEMLKQLKNHFRVFLLSNTNATHLDWVYDDLDKTHGVSDFEKQFFHNAYYSHLLKLRKPNLDIFEYVLQDAGIKASETLFIDDNADNIDAAAKVGIQTIHHRIGDEVIQVIQREFNM
ncbi:MAG: HAD family hydrolase [Saprospiraceae bacterium]